MNRIALLALVTVLLSGCIFKKTQGLVFNEQQRIIMEPAVLAQGVIVENPVIGSENHQTIATINMSNSQPKVVNIAYRLYWYDKQGLNVETSNTLYQQIAANSDVKVCAVTSSPRATNVRVHVFLSSKAGE
ncbi:YcfL family protein [Providencia rettgeri]|uniref:YcfL family protein n=1 Tax=Providencia TaxID=586 RepID=UPI001B36D87D|nr:MULTISPECIES: YcfL family protein [Providencia]MBQ0531773.1 YcfL family protein [Providencia rettgeri]WOB88147.1 YcfL family protein [Providencia sp. PROV040]